MKSKILLFLLVSFIGLTSCKKDKQPAPDALASIKTDIKGSWQLTDNKEIYYDAAGKVVRTNDQEVNAASKYEFMNDSQVKRFYPSELLFGYTLTRTNGKILMTIDSQIYEVAISNNIMTWIFSQDAKDRDYAKVVATAHFKKL